MDSAAQFLSENVYFNICHGKNSKVTAVDKFQKFRVNTPLKNKSLCWIILEKKIMRFVDIMIYNFLFQYQINLLLQKFWTFSSSILHQNMCSWSSSDHLFIQWWMHNKEFATTNHSCDQCWYKNIYTGVTFPAKFTSLVIGKALCVGPGDHSIETKIPYHFLHPPCMCLSRSSKDTTENLEWLSTVF